ncbi:hypothetical protein A5645_16570 [Mycobacterium asiaticum]|uniref:hypothetical protein n=1 Tax=Mycobacterium asiaticum TaxID=1790 RepID=UPI0007EF3FB1|nr:hypothetical protein [Mycobacterium asiaticum]OBK94371.1 hypothetical protein A5645_16570 [Mycobacterium asiaticum]
MGAPVDVGHAVFALHEPLPGHERDFNRWYERDHMYVGGILAPWTIGAARWFASDELKARRFGSGPFGPLTDGSYLTLYWIQRDHLADQQKWVAENLAGASRYEHKTVQTATTYDRVATWERDPDGVPLFLAPAHGYPGLVWLVLERTPEVSLDALADWLFGAYAGDRWAGSGVASAIAFAPRPKEPWWPPAAPEVAGVGERLMVACFLEDDPAACWDRAFAPLADAVTGVGSVLFAGPFRPTVVGTDP